MDQTTRTWLLILWGIGSACLAYLAYLSWPRDKKETVKVIDNDFELPSRKDLLTKWGKVGAMGLALIINGWAFSFSNAAFLAFNDYLVVLVVAAPFVIAFGGVLLAFSAFRIWKLLIENIQG